MNFAGMKDLPWRSYIRDVWLEDRITMTKKYGLAAVAGLALIAFGFIFKEDFKMLPLIFIGILMLFLFFIHETVFTVWHWKRRYRGEHSDPWGAIFVIETLG
jgi:hypothetical protein